MKDTDLTYYEGRLARLDADMATIQQHGSTQAPMLLLDGKPVADEAKALKMLKASVQTVWDKAQFTLANALNGTQEKAELGSFRGTRHHLHGREGREMAMRDWTARPDAYEAVIA